MTVPLLMAATDPIVPSGSNAQLDPRRARRHRGDRAADHLAQAARLPGPDDRRRSASASRPGWAPRPSVAAFAKGFGDTMGGVGILIGLGAMYGKLLADSGGADRIVDTLVSRSSCRALPWMMALVGALIGLPMFFEVGLVLLMPVIILVARRSGLPLMRIAIPTLAGLSAMHGLVPPHPGPLIAITALGANLGLTLALGVAVAIPTVIIAGPLFSKFAARWAPVPVPDLFVTAEDEGDRRHHPAAAQLRRCAGQHPDPGGADARSARSPTSSGPDSDAPLKALIDFLGTPAIALLIAVIAGIFILGRGGKMNKDGHRRRPWRSRCRRSRASSSSSAPAAGSSRC